MTRRLPALLLGSLLVLTAPQMLTAPKVWAVAAPLLSNVTPARFKLHVHKMRSCEFRHRDYLLRLVTAKQGKRHSACEFPLSSISSPIRFVVALTSCGVSSSRCSPRQ